MSRNPRTGPRSDDLRRPMGRPRGAHAVSEAESRWRQQATYWASMVRPEGKPQNSFFYARLAASAALRVLDPGHEAKPESMEHHEVRMKSYALTEASNPTGR